MCIKEILPGSSSNPEFYGFVTSQRENSREQFKYCSIQVSSWNKWEYIPLVGTVVAISRAVLATFYLLEITVRFLIGSFRSKKALREAKWSFSHLKRAVIASIPLVGSLFYYVDRKKKQHIATDYRSYLTKHVLIGKKQNNRIFFRFTQLFQNYLRKVCWQKKDIEELEKNAIQAFPPTLALFCDHKVQKIIFLPQDSENFIIEQSSFFKMQRSFQNLEEGKDVSKIANIVNHSNEFILFLIANQLMP